MYCQGYAIMNDNEQEKFMNKLRNEIMSGLKHGFFDFQITREVIKGKKRRITFKAGKTFVFILNEDEL